MIQTYSNRVNALQSIDLFIHTATDIPITMKGEIMKILKEKNWIENAIPVPTLLQRMIRERKE